MPIERTLFKDQTRRSVYEGLRAVPVVKRGICNCESFTFKEWVDNLEERLAQYLIDHLELPEPEEVLKTKREFGTIKVQPSLLNPNCWNVYEDGMKRMSFYGDDAQQKATKWAADYLNGII